MAAYQREARADVEGIAGRGAAPIAVGGSGLYVRALLDELEFPGTDPAVRAAIEAQREEIGAAGLHRLLAEKDPVAAATIDAANTRRVVRALEVIELTGKPFSASRPTIGEPRWGTRILGLRCALPELDERLAARTARMFADGLVDEVRALVAEGLLEGVTARRAIGYAQVLDEMDDGLRIDDDGLARAEERTFIGTRRYVRRQRSWFGRDHRIAWIDTDTAGVADGAPTPLQAALEILGQERG